ncbi:hypothetical protein BCON_0169g00090 [Botryotinia convoluta]|uniref:Uncharacterized protein n=1 Tax=Botryotinia convoluta TaxID=54673 RepID=A0A4Z1HQM2_9HELO|nr:hypothetical protein BCON_0169g00090 [Botryotinia convoluta]
MFGGKMRFTIQAQGSNKSFTPLSHTSTTEDVKLNGIEVISGPWSELAYLARISMITHAEFYDLIVGQCNQRPLREHFSIVHDKKHDRSRKWVYAARDS